MRRLGFVTALVPLVLAINAGSPNSAVASDSRHSTDTRVNVGSPSSPFPRNKQNEPAVGVALDSTHPSVLAAGSNDEIDNSPCHGNSCSFTPGITDNGIYFSFNAGKSWTQPTYTGLSARTGTPQIGPIGTVPWFTEAGLVGDGDPSLAFGPKPGPHGFAWANGSRLYYSSLTSNAPGSTAINAVEAIAVSRTDNVAAAAAGTKSAWMSPVVASNQLTPQTFSDKEEIWVDNAASSPNFGNAYLCWVSFGATTAPLVFARSTDGGTTWSNPVPITNGLHNDSFCTIRTDSKGKVYLMWERSDSQARSNQLMVRSNDGGQTFDATRRVADVVEVGALDPVHVANGDPRFTFDGIAGARTGSGTQLDIANGAPTGTDATNQMVLTWSDGRHGLNHEVALVETSRDSGHHWSNPVEVQAEGDRPDFPAVAISPDGRDVYLTYDAFLAPWRTTTSTSRPMQGVVRGARVGTDGSIGEFQTLHRGKLGDARGSSENNLCCEFLGDYNYVSASRTFGAAVWNDVRDAAVCPAMNAYRQSFLDPVRLPKPAPLQVCPATFGNSDIFGGSFSPPSE